MKCVWMDKNTICLRVRPCRWGRCIFCGFKKDTDSETTPEDIWEQFKTYKETYGGYPEYYRVFNSGSFFDSEQMQVSWKDVIKYLKENGVKKLRVESRPEFIPNEKLEIEMEVCVGLETVFPNRSKEIGKGFDFGDIKKLVSENRNFEYIIYILAKPYAVDNETAIKEFKVSLEQSLLLPNIIQVHAMYCRPAKGTKLNKLWNEKKWSGMPLKSYYEVVRSFNDPRLTFDTAMPFFVNFPKSKKSE